MLGRKPIDISPLVDHTHLIIHEKITSVEARAIEVEGWRALLKEIAMLISLDNDRFRGVNTPTIITKLIFFAQL